MLVEQHDRDSLILDLLSGLVNEHMVNIRVPAPLLPTHPFIPAMGLLIAEGRLGSNALVAAELARQEGLDDLETWIRTTEIFMELED